MSQKRKLLFLHELLCRFFSLRLNTASPRAFDTPKDTKANTVMLIGNLNVPYNIHLYVKSSLFDVTQQHNPRFHAKNVIATHDDYFRVAYDRF